MIPTPADARRAAQSAVGDVKLLHGCVREHLSGSEIGAVVDAVLEAVLPRIEQDVPDHQRRAIELDTMMMVRRDFRRAIVVLPEIAPPGVAFILSTASLGDAFWQEGKAIQREHGLSAVPPRVEQECGAGTWSFMRKGIMAGLVDARQPSPPSAEPPSEDLSLLHRLIENTFSWALKRCNYLNPAHMDSLIAETRKGMKPEQAATWRHRDEKGHSDG